MYGKRGCTERDDRTPPYISAVKVSFMKYQPKQNLRKDSLKGTHAPCEEGVKTGREKRNGYRKNDWRTEEFVCAPQKRFR